MAPQAQGTLLGGRVGRRRALGGLAGLGAVLGLAACGGVAAAGGSPTMSGGRQQVFLTIMGGVKLAPDGQLHDAVTPADFAVAAGRPVDVTVYNYDDAPHSFTSKELGTNPTLAGATQKGVPAVTTFSFVPAKAGKYRWQCDLPCDGDADGWAMANPGYMSGYVTVVAG